MIAPAVEPGMKQSRQFSRLRIKPGEVRAFVEIAMMTGEGQVFRHVPASVLTRRNVIDVEWQRFLLLAQPGIHQAALTCAMT